MVLLKVGKEVEQHQKRVAYYLLFVPFRIVALLANDNPVSADKADGESNLHLINRRGLMEHPKNRVTPFLGLPLRKVTDPAFRYLIVRGCEIGYLTYYLIER
jgi:hypothetical protein